MAPDETTVAFSRDGWISRRRTALESVSLSGSANG